ncbi:hypothetical protein V5799_017870, partial [Amblyomma americanum]
MEPSLSLQEDQIEWSLLLEALVGAAEKGAQLARACRAEELLFQLLVEEKAGSDRNPRFVHDFKTLADVLIQEMVRHDLSCLCLFEVPVIICGACLVSDSTSEYISGKWGDEDEGSSVVSSGLQCVSVLIGVYDRSTGLPVAGVVNQPFHHLDDQN